jgi:hypothetical protein
MGGGGGGAGWGWRSEVNGCERVLDEMVVVVSGLCDETHRGDEPTANDFKATYR